MDGVKNTVVGYCGGKYPFPTYTSVCAGITGHSEAIQVRFDPTKVSYDDLLRVFFKNHSAFTPARVQYMSAIFYTSDDQKKQALAAIERVTSEFGREPVTKVVKAGKFHAAEDYHQHYLRKKRRA